MVNKIKYVGSSSTGKALLKGGTRQVLVTAEALVTPYEPDDDGFAGDTITYTATVLDSKSQKINVAFIASLKVNGTVLIASQVFNSSVYDQGTGLLTLAFIVPDDTTLPEGDYTVKLEWASQIITLP